MPYDPYVNPDRLPATGRYKWEPNQVPAGEGNYITGFNFMIFKRGVFRNDYFVSDSNKTLSVLAELNNSTSKGSFYFPINNSFRKLQTPGKNVSVSSEPYSIAGSDFSYLITLSQSARLASATFKYKMSVDIYDENLLGFMESSAVSTKEADIEKVKKFRQSGPSSVIMDVDWSQYAFLTIKLYTSTDDDKTAVQWPQDKSELKATGYYYNNFDSSEDFKNTNVRFSSLSNPQSNTDFKLTNRLKLFNESKVKVKLILNNIMLFNFGKNNFLDKNFPCSLMSYSVPVEISLQVSQLIDNFIWPSSDIPAFSIKMFCPDDKINTRGFAHTLDVKFIIAAFPDAFASFITGGLFTNARVIFVGPTLGKRSTFYYLSPSKLSGISGVLIRANNISIFDWTDKIVVQKVESSSEPSSSANWLSIFSFERDSQGLQVFDNQDINFISDYLFHDERGTEKSWYRLIQSSYNTGISESSLPFIGQIYTEKSVLDLNTTGLSSAKVVSLIRSASVSPNLLSNNKPLAVFELSFQDDFYTSSIFFKKGLFKFNFSGKSFDPNFLFSSHVYLRMWFQPGSEPVDYDNPEKYRTSESELIFQNYTNSSGGIGTKIVIGTPTSLAELLVSAPLISDLNNFEIVKFTDGLIDKNNNYIPYKDQASVKLVVGLYVHSYLNDSLNPNLVNKINAPTVEILVDSNNTLLETPILKNTKDAIAPQRFFDYNNVTTTVFDILNFSLSKNTYLDTSLETSGFLEYNKTFVIINENDFPNSYAYQDLLSLRQAADPQKIVLKIPKYSLVNDNSIYYFVDFVTYYNSFINTKVNQGTINYKITFDLDYDNSLILNKIKVAAFFVSRYGKITERIFISGFFDLPKSIDTFTLNKTIEINIPFYVSYNDCQIVFRIYYYPYSSTGKDLTDEEMQEIEQNLNGKPMGIRINDIELTFSQGLLSFSNRNEGVSIGAVNYEDLALVPSTALDSQQFWFASKSSFESYLPTDKNFEISGAIYSPSWFVNLPDDMEAEIRVNTIQKSSDSYFRQITYRTVPLDERILKDEKISAAESNSSNSTVHVAKNSSVNDSVVQTLSTNNTVNYYRLPDPITPPVLEGLVSNSNYTSLKGDNPDLNLIDYFEDNNDLSTLSIKTELSDSSENQDVFAVNYANGFLNKWQFDGQVVNQLSSGLNKSTVSFDKITKNVYVTGYANPGALIVKSANLKNPGQFKKVNSQSQVVTKIISFNYLVDGLSSAVYDTDQSLVTAENLSGLPVLETFSASEFDNQGNLIVGYVLDGLNNQIQARMLKSTIRQISNAITVVDMGQIVGNSALNVFCPVLKYYNSVFYLLFWCAGKLFLTKFSNLPIQSSNFTYNLNPMYLIAGNHNFDDTSNSAHPFFKQLVSQEKIIILKNDYDYFETDISMQAAGMVVSTNSRFAGSIFVYYKLPSGDLVVKQVSPGGMVSNPSKIGD